MTELRYERIGGMKRVVGMTGLFVGSRKIKKDSPEPPRLSFKPSRLEGQLDDLTVQRACCKVVAE